MKALQIIKRVAVDEIEEYRWRIAASILSNDIAEELYQLAHDHQDKHLRKWANKFQQSHGQYQDYKSQTIHLLREVPKLKNYMACNSYPTENIDEILKDIFRRLRGERG